MSPQQEGARSEEYPIRALVRADTGSLRSAGWPQKGEVIMVRQGRGSERFNRQDRFYAFDKDQPGMDFPFVPESLILEPTDAQIAEERAKAGLPPLETAPAVPEPVRAEGPSKEFLFAFNEGMKYQAGISNYQNEREAWEAFHKGGAQ